MARRIQTRPDGEEARAQRRYYETANNPPIDAGTHVVKDGALSHSTGGAKGHQRTSEGDGEDAGEP